MGNNNSAPKNSEKENSREADVRVAPPTSQKEPEPVLIPTKFTWRYGGSEVLLTGSFSNWRESVVLKPGEGDEMSTTLSLAPGSYEYKFIVDNQWRYDGKQPVVKGRNGNINNIIEVVAQAPESADGKDAQLNEDAQYGTVIETDDDLAKEPPLLPPQLQISLLNAPMDALDAAIMPVPQHVVLNHLHVANRGPVIAFATAHRFRKKYFTSVMFTKSSK
jgi:5'-AMP-activated protein kinase regulatory beta subunit